MSLGVVIVHFGSPQATTACVRSAVDDPSAVERRIVVVDNQGDLDAVALPAGVELLRSADNPGFGVGANRGVEQLTIGGSAAGYVVLNNDVELLPGFLAAAREALGPGVGAAGGPLYLDRARRRLWYAGGGVSLATGTVWQRRSPSAAFRRRRVGFIPAAALAVARAAWEDVGGFDPGYFLYNEDVDLCLRLRRRGWRLLFEPGMQAVHHLGGATGSAGESALYLEQLTWTRLRPFRPWALRAYLALVHSGYNLLRCGALLLRRGPGGRSVARAIARGHRAALRELFGGRSGAGC